MDSYRQLRDYKSKDGRTLVNFYKSKAVTYRQFSVKRERGYGRTAKLLLTSDPNIYKLWNSYI